MKRRGLTLKALALAVLERDLPAIELPGEPGHRVSKNFLA